MRPVSRPGPFGRAARIAGGALLVLATVVAPAASGSATMAAAPARLPDLIMRPPALPSDAASRVCGIGVSPAAIIGAPIEACAPETAGDRWLRFGSIIGNRGRGPLRLVLTRPSDAVETMSAVQRVKTGRGWASVPSDAVARWAKLQDGHDHWHVDAMEAYRLFPAAAPGSVGVGVKRGFCFADGMMLPGRHAGRPPYPGVYGFYSCQGYTLVESEAYALTRMVVGLSPGWADLYPWDFAGQRIDLAGVPDGEYLVCLTADPLDVITEADETNNESWARIAIATVEGPPYAVQVTELAAGRGACAARLPYEIPAAASAPAVARRLAAGR